MADFLFNLAQKVLEKVAPLILQEISLAWGVRGDLQKLQESLTTIKAVLLDAEEQQAKNHRLCTWLGKLKDVCVDAEDVLEEFEYQALQHQVAAQGGFKTKVRGFFSHMDIKFRFLLGHKIKKIRERLGEIAAEKADFDLDFKVEGRRVLHKERDSHSFVRSSDVVGRESEKEHLLSLLMHSSDRENVSVIPIFGLGGLGKTALAKVVYNDEKVNAHFQLKMWVCVSDDFDVKKLSKRMIEEATHSKCDDLTLNELQSRLREILDGRKFLLILDDVWNNDREKWIELRNLLLDGASGSKIVVTTRSQSIASFMGTLPPCNLKGLLYDDCLSLFVKCAFREGEEKQHPSLMEIGKKIVTKCGGVPLAVRTVGSMLYSKTNESEWLFVLNNDLQKLKQEESHILPALRVSYEHIPSYLQQCLVYCAIFPKDFEFNNNHLVALWMAEGLIQSSDEIQDLEDIGNRYIQELLSLSFFQDFEDCGNLFSFKLHDLVHDLCSSMAQREFSIVNFHTSNLSERVRRISFSDTELLGEEVPRFLFKLNGVRTILFQNEGVGARSKSFVEACTDRFKYLRVLDLSYSSFEVLPSSIGNVRHLRYLDLGGNRKIRKLPNSICKLLKLQNLILEQCKELEELPRDIGNMISLRRFYLTTKQTLLPEERIRRLKSLRYLSISGCVNLKSLGEGLQSLITLRSLIIAECASLESLPCGIKCLTTLENLGVFDCERLDLVELGEDTQNLKLSLQNLTIGGLPKLVALPQWLQGAANTLQFMGIGECPNLTTLPEWLPNLPSLRRLLIEDCPKLSALPEGMHCLTSLRKLEINNCELIRRCQAKIGADWPKIAHVPEIFLDNEKIKSTDDF